MLIFGGILKLFGDLCGLVGPLSISYIVDFINLQLSNETNSNVSDLMIAGAGSTMEMKIFNENDYITMMNFPNWSEFIANGWIMAFIVLIAFLLQGTFSQASTNLVNMEGIKIKNALQGLIYRKTLSLSGSCFYKSNATNSKGTSVADNSNSNDNGKITDDNDGNDDDDNMNDVGKITNLMSDDSLNIMSFFWIVHYVWSIPLKVMIFILNIRIPNFSINPLTFNSPVDNHYYLLSLLETGNKFSDRICCLHPVYDSITICCWKNDVFQFKSWCCKLKTFLILYYLSLETSRNSSFSSSSALFFL